MRSRSGPVVLVGTQFRTELNWNLLQYLLRFRILSDLENIYSVSTLGPAISLTHIPKTQFGEAKSAQSVAETAPLSDLGTGAVA